MIDIINKRANEQPDKIFIYYNNTSITYQEFNYMVLNLLDYMNEIDEHYIGIQINHKIKLLVLIVAINRLKKIPVLYPDIPNTKDYIKTTNVPIAFTDIDIIISKKQNSNSQTNILGVRPEKMFLSDKKGIPGEVYGSEYLGTRKILTIQSQFGTYKVRVSNDVNLKIGSNVKINFESESAIIYDNQTDEALLSEFIN